VVEFKTLSNAAIGGGGDLLTTTMERYEILMNQCAISFPSQAAHLIETSERTQEFVCWLEGIETFSGLLHVEGRF
jgi:hypothetical protein